jgi:Tfp pilus assembly protein PilX
MITFTGQSPALRSRRRCARRGAAAVVMITLLIVVNLIIVGLVLGGSRDQDLTIRRVETVQAFYAAEGGMNMAVRELATNTDDDGDGAVGSISDDSDTGTDPALSGAALYVTMDAAGGETTLRAFGRSGLANRKIEAALSGSGSGTQPGLLAKYFTFADGPHNLDEVTWTDTPATTGTVTQINVPSTNGSLWGGGPTDHFAVEYSGSITIPSDGSWTFYTESDDGSMLWVDGTEVVDNDGQHGMTERSGSIVLTAGTYSFMVRAFENGGGFGIIARWAGPGVSKEEIPVGTFTH